MASRQDLDNWAELGNKGWSFDDLKPYYQKFETYHPASETLGEKIDNKYLDKSLRGTSGPIHVSGSVYLSRFVWSSSGTICPTLFLLPTPQRLSYVLTDFCRSASLTQR